MYIYFVNLINFKIGIRALKIYFSHTIHLASTSLHERNLHRGNLLVEGEDGSSGAINSRCNK